MADPLSLLRTYVINKEDLVIKDNDIIFGDLSWPKTVDTNFMMYGSGKDGEPKKYYTLECLVFLLKHVHLSHPVYVRKAGAENIPVVRRPDRKQLLAYLYGEKSTHTSIDKNVPLEIPTQVKRSVEGVQELPAKKRRIENTLEGQMVKQQLDETNESEVNVDNIKSLTEAMSVEKIAAIKAKRLAKKRTTIKGHDDIGLGPDLRIMLDFDVDITKDIIKKEREWRTRTTTLQSNGKVFRKNIFAIHQSIKNRENGRSCPMCSMSATPRVASTKSTIPQPTVHNRYDQERFNKSREDTEGFKIDTMGTYHGMTLKSVTEGSIPKKPIATVTPVQQSPSDNSRVDIYKTGDNCTLSNTTEKVIRTLGYCLKPLNYPSDCNSEYSDYNELMNTGQYIIKTINERNVSGDLVDSYYSTNCSEESLTNKRSPEVDLAPNKKIVKSLDTQSVNHGAGTSYLETVEQDVNIKKCGSSTKKVFEELDHLTSIHLNIIEEKHKENLNLLALKKAKLQLEILEIEYNVMILRHNIEKEKCISELKQNKLKEQILESELKQNKMNESILSKQLIDNK